MGRHKQETMLEIAKDIIWTNKALGKGTLRKNFCDFMQRIMNNGGCESLINDDRGYWAIGGNGIQNVPLERGPQDITTTFILAKGDFSKTIDGALIKWAKEVIAEEI